MSFRVKGLAKAYKDPQGIPFEAVGPVDLNVPEGQFLCLLGPTGCGKTTILRLLSGLEKPTSGACDTGSGRLSYVFQQGALFPWLTVESNVSFPLRARGTGKREAETASRRILEQVGLSGFEKSFPHELSGGMQQRTALARGLVTEPDLLLLDEPFGSLDEGTSIVLQEMVYELCTRLSTTVVFVTHNIEEAVFLGDRVVVMGHRPGRIARDEMVSLPRPRDRMSSEFTDLMLSFRRTFEELVEPS